LKADKKVTFTTVDSASPQSKRRGKDINAEFVVEDAPKPFNRSDFIYESVEEDDVNKLITTHFDVIVAKVSIKELLNMLCFVKGTAYIPKVNHHFVTLDRDYLALKNAFELELKQGTFLLNNRMYVTCFRMVSKGNKKIGSTELPSHKLVPLYTLEGKKAVNLYASLITDTTSVNAMIEDIQDPASNKINNWANPHNVHEMTSVHIGASDGGHRIKTFIQLAQDRQKKGLIDKNYTLDIHVLVPKTNDTPPNKILDNLQTISSHVMHITKKGKGHTLWDTFQTIFNLMQSAD
jgi:hypothetical protein